LVQKLQGSAEGTCRTAYISYYSSQEDQDYVDLGCLIIELSIGNNTSRPSFVYY